MDVRGFHRRICLVLMWLLPMSVGGFSESAMALDFSGDRIIKKGNSVVTAHVNAKDDRWRFEFTIPQQGASVIIVRVDRGTTWSIFSKRRLYLEEPITNDHRLEVSEKMPGELSREFVGDEMLNGHPTELFEVTVAEGGETRQYYRWITKVQRFPMKTVSKQGDWSEEYRRLVFTEQSRFLFELPQRLDPANPPTNNQPTSNNQ